MERSNRARVSRRMPVPSANERLKQGWSLCLSWSMTAAAAAHLAMFGVWTGPDAEPRRPITRPAVAQLVPIASTRLLPDPREVPAVTHPDSEVPERRVEVVRNVVDAETRELLEVIDLPPPSLVHPDPATPADGLPVASVRAVVRSPALTVPAFTWPDLRNPRAVVSFLRRGYNPLALESVAGRSVSVKIALAETGAIEWSEIHESSGHSALDRLALAVINEIAQFTPGSRKGVPVPVVVVLSIPFEQPW